MSVTHLTGPVIRVYDRIIQRCAVCGEKLCDNKNVMVPLNLDGSVPEFPVWPEGVFLFHQSNFWKIVTVEDYPDCKDFCIDLVE